MMSCFIATFLHSEDTTHEMAALTAQYLSEKAGLQCDSLRLLKSTLWATHSLLKQTRAFDEDIQSQLICCPKIKPAACHKHVYFLKTSRVLRKVSMFRQEQGHK